MEGMPIKQTIGSVKKEEGGLCTWCIELKDITIFSTDKGMIRLCDSCNEEDDKQRYGEK